MLSDALKEYGAGYLSPEDIAGRVEVKGRGGTILQLAVSLLEQAKDFPETGPILIITDAEIEEKMQIYREHAFFDTKRKTVAIWTKGENILF